MPKLKVVFLDRATIPSQIHLKPLSFEHEWLEYDFTAPDLVAERVLDADVIITNKVVLNADNLSQAQQLKLIAVSATGVNNVDVDYCNEKNIAVANIQGYATQSVPEHVIAMLFALKRNLVGYHQDIEAGEWQKDKQFCFFTHPIQDIAGSTLGLMGSGSLGQATAALAKAIGMKVIFAERKGADSCREGYLPFDAVLQQADAISLHCPLTEATRNLISEPELAMMKPSAVLINAGRGGLVDEQALVEALVNHQIAGAGMDVFTQEPADKSNPLLANSHLSNLLLTPHVAWGSDSSIQKLSDILMDNIEAFVEGKPQNLVSE
ncbi:D-2-hydroxyacid dehydrogenase [Vibrio cyclitrophicus]|jgi:glycerate dehydrogenase|uniref:D-2-hydroxyacid dehydrogenase n=2 Tax=Vibrionaceae TaxID=641 RepID=A0AAN0LKZ4_9VIBR|nr:D-2-hydroxyacid dehydrogenase [Vibrio cyclitrophicus]ERM59641.1 Hydroxypyruvate reductase [Vibrio cyclitrophicus FF75]KAA8599874.1 Hydroxypyruvate reductase [Vibrio cyclitrophicus]MCC4775604.1 D-2-hydroxyacid dehydrogenase [Vibrio cyclitrophicus]MCC4842627.1 D-2-hydroxyacid dehydrogenase [Vibrio cyclitrophicus]NOH43995.1 D-2-hydroxyacid dehydrogenase [Vibrio cyclitrophicus]|tara:strand:- start:2793 stop:3758 length:966 start_codon:yes stop_codon:yes gene_type:complete